MKWKNGRKDGEREGRGGGEAKGGGGGEAVTVVLKGPLDDLHRATGWLL